jgi:hypothetical protein
VLAETAATRPHAELRQVVHHYLERLDPDGPEPDPTEQRALTLVTHPDGSMTDHFELDAVGGKKVHAVVESFVQADRPAGDLRNRRQQLGDGFVQWADNTLAAGHAPILRTVKPQTLVMINLDDLADPHTGPGTATTGFGARISTARARMLACDGNITRIIIGPQGQPLDLGRTHRVVPPHLRRAVEARDRHCVFTGCQAPSYWCDVHHLLHWADDERHRWRTRVCCANGTTPRSTTDSASNDNPAAVGAPGDPTAPRSSCTPTCLPAEVAREGSRCAHPVHLAYRVASRSSAGHGSLLCSQGRTVSSGHCCCHLAALAP